MKQKKINVGSFSGLPVAVFGLGRSGLSAALALKRSGAKVTAWDDDAKARERAAAAGAPLLDPYAGDRGDWSKSAALVLSPGIALRHPKPHPVAELARRVGVEIIGDIELLFRSQGRATFLGVTGTNGKSTTTALIGHILKVAGKAVEIGGNLGTPALELEPLGDGGTYVLELSSYQLELLPTAAFDIAVLLNISADHLDRHGGMAGYIAAKKNIFRNRRPSQTAIIGIDDDHGRAIHDALKERRGGKVIPVSGNRAVAGGVYVSDGVLYDATGGGQAVAIADLAAIASLPGGHNAQNAAAAYAAARAAGVAAGTIAGALKTFPGLVHRQELVDVIDGVSYINDSKATNVAAALRALVCYGDIYWIAGGRAKRGGFRALTGGLANVRRAFLIGEAANDIAEVLRDYVPWTISGDLPRAVEQARRAALDGRADDAERGGVVLLSPACASFDQFGDFEARGEAFREAVAAVRGAGS